MREDKKMKSKECVELIKKSTAKKHQVGDNKFYVPVCIATIIHPCNH
jgi:hypothetical protein